MKTISSRQIGEMLAAAESSPRKRSHIIVHESHQEPVQRIMIGLKRGTYVRPHRHATVGEFGVVISGHCSLLCFDDDGNVTSRHEMGPAQQTSAYDLKENEWHSLIVMSDEAVFFECKAGPFDPDNASEFAAWALPEGDPGVPDYLDRMTTAQPG